MRPMAGESRQRASAPARILVLLLLASLLLARLVAMAELPLMDTTEARYGEIARKMAELGDWVTPWHDTGVPFWGKPPLSFWLSAASLRVLGTSEFAARLPQLLCTLLTLALIWHLGRQRAPREGGLAAALLAGSLGVFVGAAAVMTDPALVLGTTLSMAGFWLALHHEDRRARGRHGWLMFAGRAIGLLAKGPVALVLVGVPLLLWTVMSRRAATVWRAIPWLRGAALTLLLVAPWYLLAERHTPGFLRYFLLGEHWHRFMTPGWSGDLYGFAHRVAPGSIWLYALAAALPWPLLVLLLLKRRLTAESPESTDAAYWRHFLLLWALWPLIFFTAARNIIWTYVLPSLPAVALLTAGWLERRFEPARAERWVATGLSLTLLASVAALTLALQMGRDEGASARAVVRAFEHRHSGIEPLYFLGHKPFSGAFYSNGQARVAADADELARRLGHGEAFVATRSAAEVESLRSALPDHYLRDLGHFGAFDLLLVTPGSSIGAVPSAIPAPVPRGAP